ncbi:MAG: cyclic nucleotide-binding domain-containing protein, partial [bacterium]|nr:cyclic nucleotide-binding domain-containing protein [bacterium]
METLPNSPDTIIKEYSAGEYVVEEGAASDRFFIILEGSVEILRHNKRIRVLKDGDVFGLEYFYLKCPYALTAKAVNNCRLAVYHIGMINDIIYEKPQLIQLMLSSVLRQLEDTSRTAEELMTEENSADLAGFASDIKTIEALDSEESTDFHSDVSD